MRGINRLLGLIVAVGLAVASAIVVVEVVAAELGSNQVIVNWPDWEQRLRVTSWVDARPTFFVTGGVAIVVLLVQVLRRRQALLAVTDQDRLRVTVRRRFLERQLTSTVGSIDGVANAQVRWRPKRVLVTADTNRQNPKGLRQAIDDTVESELRRLAIANPPARRTRLRSSR